MPLFSPVGKNWGTGMPDVFGMITEPASYCQQTRMEFLNVVLESETIIRHAIKRLGLSYLC